MRADGTPFRERIAPRRAQAHLTGADAVEAMRRVLNERRRGARVVRLVCSPDCQRCQLYAYSDATLVGSELHAQTRAGQYGRVGVKRPRNGEAMALTVTKRSI